MTAKIIKIFIPQWLILRRCKCSSNHVALSFDDGPDPVHTENILKILAQENVKATFFLIGNNVKKYPDLVKKIAIAGHDVGLHSYSHQKYTELSISMLLHDINKCKKEIFEIIGYVPYLIRSPYGKLNWKVLCAALIGHARLIHWSLDLQDSFINSAVKFRNAIHDCKITRGDIILLHEDVSYIVEILPDLISKIKKEGFTFTTISQLKRNK